MMTFKAGEYVAHANYGVGQIIGIEKIQYLGNEPRPYYIVAIDNGTMWVPVEETVVNRIRAITSKDDLPKYREILISPPVPFNHDRYKRRCDYIEHLKQGSFQALCEVVRDLTAQRHQKTLNENDSSTLQKCVDRLTREWSMAAGISLHDASMEIQSLLRQDQKGISITQ